jgi:imidazolonepropionase
VVKETLAVTKDDGMAEKPLLIAGARQLLTLAGPRGPRRRSDLGRLGLVEDGAVLAINGRIAATGRTRDIARLKEARDAEIIDASGKVALPALVDSHTHLAFAAPRLRDYEMRAAGATYEQIAQAGGGILSSVAAVRRSGCGEILARAVFFAQQALACGAATLEVKSGYGLDAENEIKLLEVIRDAGLVTGAELVPTFLGAHVIPAEYRRRRREYIRLLVDEMIPRVARDKLAAFCDVFCDRGAFTLAETRVILEAARRHKLKLKVHAEQLIHTGAAALAAKLGATSADHLDRVTARDIAALARSQTLATLLPGACFHLGLRDYPPARRLIAGGAAVALATDFNPGTSPTLAMPMVIALAVTQMRMSPAEAIAAATINAAHAIGRGDSLGSLEVGKQADIAVFDVEDYREIPYYFGMNFCWMTVKKGKVAWRR